jgi:acetyltransferase-like isoleucine patch superfamily enzyme
MTRRLGGTYLTEVDLMGLGFRRVGRNVRVHDRASLYGLENISLGDHVRIDDFAVVIASGPLNVGSYVSIHNFCFLGARAGITLEDFVTLAPGSKLFSASDDYSGACLTGPVVPRELTGGTCAPVVLRRHTIIGAGSVILPGCTLGEGCAVGALSLVVGDLEPWGVYAGVPVTRRKERRRDLLALEDQLARRQGGGS